MSFTPHVSILLPTRDRGDLLPGAIASLRAQSWTDWELLLLDNNRHEPPLAQSPTLRRTLEEDPRIRLIATNASNAAAVRNVGLEAARGRWVTYLDDDDRYQPAKLARQLALAADGAPVVLCGAEYHLRGRRRRVQCEQSTWRGDDLILRARWNTPLLLHPHPGTARFDERLSPGEDAEFAHRLLARAGGDAVPVAAEPLVDIHPQRGPRVNTDAAPVLPAAHQILALRPGFYSLQAERRYLLQNQLAVAKLTGRPARCAVLGLRLLAASAGSDWRAVANALVVSLGWWPGRWVS